MPDSSTFNEQFGTLFTDTDRSRTASAMILPLKSLRTWHTKMRRRTHRTQRECREQALGKVMQHLLTDDTQVYRQFVENESLKRFVGDMVYALTSR